MKLNRWIESLLPKETLIAGFGEAQLVKTFDGRYQLKGGTAGDRQEAMEWISMFLHEAVCGTASGALPPN
jgi:hypothetical protein